MATLADELLNDFDESDDENEEQNGLRDNDATGDTSNGLSHSDSAGMEGLEVPVEDEDMEDAEEEEARQEGDTLEDEEDTKAKVEKMQLGGVSDVRNVAGLMKTLQPILEVSAPCDTFRSAVVYLRCQDSPNNAPSCRK